MKNMKKIISSPTFSLVSMFLAVALILFASIGGARSALQYFSQNYQARMEMHDIGVTLVENNNDVSWRNYSGEGVVDNSALSQNEQNNWIMSNGLASVGYDDLLNDIPEDNFKLGQVYDEVLKVRNTGTINQYVRVTLYKYWLDENNNSVKKTDLSPDQIQLSLDDNNVGSGKDWIVDEDSSTDERTVLYYTKLLKCEDEGGPTETTPFTDTLTIDEKIARTVTQTTDTKKDEDTGKTYTTITTVYNYDGYKFCVEAKVDAVQEHHAADAAESAWGRKVTINNNTLRLGSGN